MEKIKKKKITEHGPTHQNKTQFPPQLVSPIPPSISLLSLET